MSSVFSFGVDNGKVFVSSGADNIPATDLSELETQVFTKICAAVDAPVSCCRNSSDYLSVCNEAGNDFCRFKATNKVLWISLDMCTNNVADRPSLARVENKRKKHWKIKLASIDEIDMFADVIAEAAK